MSEENKKKKKRGKKVDMFFYVVKTLNFTTFSFYLLSSSWEKIFLFFRTNGKLKFLECRKIYVFCWRCVFGVFHLKPCVVLFNVQLFQEVGEISVGKYIDTLFKEKTPNILLNLPTAWQYFATFVCLYSRLNALQNMECL